MYTNPLLNTDGYKTSHRPMYPKGTTKVYSNYTCRSTKRMPKEAQDIVVFGIQYMCMYIHDMFESGFFSQNKTTVCQEAKAYLSTYLGTDYDVSHFEALHDLGYLPIKIKALEEGTIIQEGIPLFTIQNTLPEFFWITNYLETLISTLIWKPVHSASLALAYKRILTKWALKTNPDAVGFVDFQGHDFSFRGMQSPEAAIASAMGFLTSFKGTDTIPALQALDYYYEAKSSGFSVPASEHSVMCAHGKEDEIHTLEYLMEQFPKGILSVVSDTWDLWKLLTEYLPTLKDKIMSRDGKLVIRPDSGDPVDIICGVNNKTYTNVPGNSKENAIARGKGVVELLWDTFKGTINSQGYKVLDPHIGAIYGDSITLERAEAICERLAAKGFASTNVVFGIGSYSMGYATRDSQGGAVKSTYCELTVPCTCGLSEKEAKTFECFGTCGLEAREIFKNPVTDSGEKKSAKGLLAVFKDVYTEKLVLKQSCSKEEEEGGLLTTVFENGNMINTTTLDNIRNLITKQCA